VISADGSFVAFASTCNDLLATTDQLTVEDVFLRDLVKGTVTRVSASTSGGEGNGDSFDPQLSADGRYVAFTSYAKNLVSGSVSDGLHVYLRDMVAKKTTRVDPDMIGDKVIDSADTFALAANGAAVAFLGHGSVPPSDVEDVQIYLRYLR
jgi:Tol biopolymer transport system component